MSIPAHIPAFPPCRSMPCIRRVSKICRQERRYGDAVPLLKEALRLAPDRFEPNNELGKIAFEQKRYAAAIVYELKAHALSPETSKVTRRLALAYFRTKDYAQAHVFFTKLLEARLERTEYMANTLFYLGLCDFHRKNLRSAEGYFIQALRYNPNYGRAHHHMRLISDMLSKAERRRAKVMQIKPATLPADTSLPAVAGLSPGRQLNFHKA